MPRRKITLATEEYYHCYNRGVEKRRIFDDAQDFSYFITSLNSFNSIETLGKKRLHKTTKPDAPLVQVVASCILPNHFHFVFRQLHDGGISRLMHRLGVSYSLYYNQKNQRTGTLFQGAFKAKHLATDQDLQQVIAYVYHNNIVHDITNPLKYRNFIDTTNDIVRVRDSNFRQEVVEIIKSKRLDLET